MTYYEILNDKEALNEAKAKTKEHNIQNRLMAEKKMTEDLHASRIRFEEERKALLDEKDNLLSSASDPEARKEIENCQPCHIGNLFRGLHLLCVQSKDV